MNELFWVLTGATLVPAAAGFAAVRKSGRSFTKEAGIMTLSAVAVAAAGDASIGHFGELSAVVRRMKPPTGSWPQG